MKTHYEKPDAEVILFRALQSIAVVEEEAKDPELGIGSREEFL
jgi:hypothetical protein